MAEDTGVQIALRALTYLDGIDSSATLDEFVGLELTGNRDADELLRALSLGMLQQMRADGMVSADDLTQPAAKIYGLTPLGKEMYSEFRMLNRA